MSRWRAAAGLAGRRTLLLLGAGLAAGLALSATELAFAAALQAFLLRLGALAPEAAALPAPVAALGSGGAAGLLLGAGFLRALLVGGNTYLQGAGAEELKVRLRAAVVRRLFRGRSASSAESMALFTARAEACGSAAAAAQVLASGAATAALLFAGLLRLAPELTLAAAALLALAALPLRAADRRARHSGESIGAEWQQVTERLLAGARNLLLLQILGTRGAEERRALESLESYRRHVLVYYLVSGLKIAVPQILGLLIVCLAAAAAGRAAGTPPGALISFFYLFLRLVQVSSTASQAATTWAHTSPQIEEVLRWSERRDEELPQDAPAASPARAAGLRLRAARFRYPGAAADALGPVDLELSPGEALVVTGASGAGKSTLLSLLLGLLEPSGGSVEALLDGETLPAAKARARLLPSVGYVGPESFLVEGTAADNIRYGLAGEPSEAEVAAALRAADCGFLEGLPGGLAHRLSEQGQGLSAGQKQRLALARALLRRPALLILDEATANLDAATEARIVESLSRLKGKTTIVAVSHRPALLALADRRLEL